MVTRRRLRPHHFGAAWKVAYADFTTAMMALFVVLWLLTQADMRLRQQISQYFRQPGVLPGGAIISTDADEAHSRTRELLVAPGQGEEALLEDEKKAIEAALARRPELALVRDQVIVQVTEAGLSILAERMDPLPASPGGGPIALPPDRLPGHAG